MSNIWEGKWITTAIEAIRPNPGALAYRYVDRHGTDYYTDMDGEARPGGQYVEINLEVFLVRRYSPKGFFVMTPDGEKFIAHSWNKKYAHLNLEEARNAFKRRKRYQRNILKGQLERIERVLRSIENDKWSGRCSSFDFNIDRLSA